MEQIRSEHRGRYRQVCPHPLRVGASILTPRPAMDPFTSTHPSPNSSVNLQSKSQIRYCQLSRRVLWCRPSPFTYQTSWGMLLQPRNPVPGTSLCRRISLVLTSAEWGFFVPAMPSFADHHALTIQSFASSRFTLARKPTFISRASHRYRDFRLLPLSRAP